ncbi:hypothetical protein OIDMADRAFT_20529 [Oidiodendron maius Zn]|uniref:Uncharacterized protein n=1 Tax=Oidiodendron maius (strain Zn) TaxID=913774 RepID=A0A0C3CEF7_OIDMZ|nr:hypothetical protein OIDMADRAFT_20529 [Oidiodendron maius Zn]
MKNAKLFWAYWSSLYATSLAAFYFACRSVDARAAAKTNSDLKGKQMDQIFLYASKSQPLLISCVKEGSPRADNATSPSQESVLDPAQTRHAPYTEDQRLPEKKK